MYEGLEKLAEKAEKNNTWKDLGVSAGAAAGVGGAGYGGYKLLNKRYSGLEKKFKDITGRFSKGDIGKAEDYKRDLNLRDKLYKSKTFKKYMDAKAGKGILSHLRGKNKYYALGALALLGGAGTYGGIQLARKHNKRR